MHCVAFRCFIYLTKSLIPICDLINTLYRNKFVYLKCSIWYSFYVQLILNQASINVVIIKPHINKALINVCT